ncbi:MAG: leucine-rich repeat domain-containing protein [Planctomycetaceae bacterium]|nr:leucine-rich repeat domain-containing protein [Planctomycetaceae bacterium]
MKFLFPIHLLLLILAATGCDQVQQMAKREESQEPPQIPARPVEMPATQVADDPPPPKPKTPEEILADFDATPTHQRTNEQLQELGALKTSLDKLEVLDLTQSQVNDEGTDVLSRFASCRELILNSTLVTSVGLARLPEMPALEVLSLDGSAVDTGIGVIAKECPKLTVLSLRQTPIGDGVFSGLAEAPQLEVLHIDGNVNLTGNEMDALIKQGKFQSLRELTASNTQLGLYMLRNVEKLKNLEVLNMSNTQMADDIVKGFAQCPNLRVLRLENNQISDQGIQALARLRKLEELNLYGNPAVTDQSFNVLKNLKQLKSLNVESTGCTLDAAKLLKEKFLKETEIVIQNQAL